MVKEEIYIVMKLDSVLMDLIVVVVLEGIEVMSFVLYFFDLLDLNIGENY